MKYVVLLRGALTVLSACATVEGVQTDISNATEKVQELF